VKAQLAQGRLAEAEKQISTAKGLAEKTQYRMLRLQFQIVSAQARAATGKPADFEAAAAILEQTMKEAEKAGIMILLYETKLALGEIEIKAGKTVAGRLRLVALEKDAKRAGFALVARKAAKAGV
jgi:hypothetical protein